MKHTCPACGQRWAVVLTSGKAHPGHTAEAGYWVPEGDSAALTLEDTGAAMNTYRWPCLCGADLSVLTPAYETVECRPGGTPCIKAEGRRRPLGYVLPSEHGGAWQACPCCGHQGVHHVRRDRTGHLPACLR